MYASLVELGIIPMNSTGIYLNGFTPNSTGHEILVKMGGNSLRLHLYACLIELGIIPVISTQFEGGIKFYPPPVKFDQSNFKFDWALNTGQIGWKFTEITLYACLVECGIISMDLHPI